VLKLPMPGSINAQDDPVSFVSPYHNTASLIRLSCRDTRRYLLDSQYRIPFRRAASAALAVIRFHVCNLRRPAAAKNR